MIQLVNIDSDWFIFILASRLSEKDLPLHEIHQDPESAGINNRHWL